MLFEYSKHNLLRNTNSLFGVTSHRPLCITIVTLHIKEMVWEVHFLPRIAVTRNQLDHCQVIKPLIRHIPRMHAIPTVSDVLANAIFYLLQFGLEPNWGRILHSECYILLAIKYELKLFLE